jgi:hypothetical protein
VKPQDNFLLIPTPLSTSRLTDIEEIFVYKFLSNINLGPPVFFYVDEQKPDCLLIATEDGNSVMNDMFYTATRYPVAGLNLIAMEKIVLIRILEIIFFFKRPAIQRK